MKKNGNQKMLIAVSGGPDSMALFDMARRYGISLVCMHVNYQKRDTANRDESIVSNYCRKYQIPFIKINAHGVSGNFQKWARDFRYGFFKKVANIYNVDDVLMAHQLDDYIETVIMQIKRGSTPFNFGIKDRIEEFGLNIYRPLLRYAKKDLEDYCLMNGIEFGIDESNLGNHYQRNRIRHQIVDKLDYKCKISLFECVENINRKRNEYINEIKTKYIKNIYSIEELRDINDLDTFLRVKLYHDLSSDHIKEIKRQIFSADSFMIDINNRTISKYRSNLYFDNNIKGYEYTIKKHEELITNFFKIVDKADSFRCVTVDENDFPLKIRNYKNGDCIEMVYGKKHIARFFIDNKIPLIWRKRWPIIENCKGEIILVPGIGCNKTHYSIKPNLFMIELLNMEDYSCIEISKKS